MTIKEIQHENRMKEKYMKLLVGILRFFIRPAILMLAYWLVIALPFDLQPLTYFQAILLQIVVNLINEV